MKKTFISVLTVALVLAFFGSALAGGPAKYGVKAGIVVADETYEYDPNPDNLSLDPDSRTGLSLAVFYEYPLISQLSVRPGLEYIQKGSKLSVLRTAEDSPEIVGNEVVKNRVSYLSLPVLASLSIPVGKSSTNLLFGPRLDFKLSSDAELLVDDDYNTTVFGLTFGVGQELPLRGLISAFAEFNYYHDLGNSYEKGALTVKNKSFSIMGGMKF